MITIWAAVKFDIRRQGASFYVSSISRQSCIDKQGFSSLSSYESYFRISAEESAWCSAEKYGTVAVEQHEFASSKLFSFSRFLVAKIFFTVTSSHSSSMAFNGWIIVEKIWSDSQIDVRFPTSIIASVSSCRFERSNKSTRFFWYFHFPSILQIRFASSWVACFSRVCGFKKLVSALLVKLNIC